MTAQFCRMDFPATNRPVLNVMGAVVPDFNPFPAGSHLIQWMDPVRAVGWFRQAQKIIQDFSRLQALWAPVNLKDQRANRAQATMQFQYFVEVLSALAHGYNMLNIVWWNDPIARALYRKYISGPPTLHGANFSSALYEMAQDYNEGWYSGTALLPKATRFSENANVQNSAITYTRSVPGNVRFAISAMLMVAPYGNLGPMQTAETASAVYNVPMVRMKSMQTCYPKPGFPWTDQCGSWTSLSQGNSTLAPLQAILPDGTKLPYGFDDWRAAYTGSLYNGFMGPGITAPLQVYWNYLREWVIAVNSRTPYNIIQDARSFVLYTNNMTVQNNGSTVQEAIGKIAGSATDVFQQQSQPNSELLYASGIAASVGVATGPIGSIIGGAVAAVTAAAAYLVPHGVTGHGRDDLGRWKLQFERAWLSGNPISLDPGQGTPSLPDYEYQDPPGIGQTWSPMNCPAAASSGSSDASGGSSGTSLDGSRKTSFPGWVIPAGIAGIGLLGYVWYQNR